MTKDTESSLATKRNKRACDQCSKRKIRCNGSGDSTKPCDPCDRSGLRCTYNREEKAKGPRKSTKRTHPALRQACAKLKLENEMFRDPLGMGEGHTSVLQVSQPRDGIEYYSTPYSSVTSISAFFRPQTPRSSSDLPELKDLGSHSGVELYGTPRSSLNSTGTNETLFDVSLGPTSHHNLQNVDLPGTADVSVAFNHETGSSNESPCFSANRVDPVCTPLDCGGSPLNSNIISATIGTEVESSLEQSIESQLAEMRRAIEAKIPHMALVSVPPNSRWFMTRLLERSWPYLSRLKKAVMKQMQTPKCRERIEQVLVLRIRLVRQLRHPRQPVLADYLSMGFRNFVQTILNLVRFVICTLLPVQERREDSDIDQLQGTSEKSGALY